jgi:hypothetical protein
MLHVPLKYFEVLICPFILLVLLSSDIPKYTRTLGIFTCFSGKTGGFQKLCCILNHIFHVFRKICLFVLFIAAWAIFQLSSGCHKIGDRAANLDLCLALMAFSSEGSFSGHTYCDTGQRSHPKNRHPRPTVGFERGVQARITRFLRLHSM